MGGTGKGKTGSSTSRFGGANRRLNTNKLGKAGNSVTYGQASVSTVATQAQLNQIKANYREYEKKKRRELLNMRQSRGAARLAFFQPGCQDTLRIYGYTKKNVPGGTKGRFLCKVRPYRESKYSTQPNEVRIFVEGAEVSSYVRDGITWSTVTTGGMNNCSFTLNNDSDAFIITPANVCADLNISGWRISRSKKYAFHPGREGNRFDEAAKYLIYRKKYKLVDPKNKEGANIDETGMWLYPLNPYSVIFNKHDCVRVFTRLPHTMGVSRKIAPKKWQWLGEHWAPAFTGFIQSCSWSDDPVGGDRSVKITCYDYKGILERMRVRLTALRVVGGNQQTKTKFNKNLFGATVGKDDKLKYDQKSANIRGRKLQELGLTALLYEYTNLLATYKLAKAPDADSYETQEKIGRTTRLEVNKLVVDFIGEIGDATRAAILIREYTAEGWDVRLSKKSKKIRFLKTKALGGVIDKSQTPINFEDYFKNLAQNLRVREIEENRKVVFSRTLWNASSLNSRRLLKTIFEDLIKRGEQSNGSIIDSQRGMISFAKYFLPWKEVLSNINQIAQKNGGQPIFLEKSINLIFIENFKTFEDLNKWQMNASGAVTQYQSEAKTKVEEAKQKGKKAAAKIEYMRDNLEKNLIPALQKKIKALQAAGKAQNIRKAQDIIYKIKSARSSGKSQQDSRVKGAEAVLTLWEKEPTFEGRTAGMFDDLIRKVSVGSPHPLAGMSFEQAIEWLLCEQTRIVLGVNKRVGKYKDGVMEEYNRNALFGLIGRPLTFTEVGVVGSLTTSDYENDVFSPWNAFYHLLSPETGTGASTIVQADITANPLNAQSIQYTTRLALANQICELLDFQFYINPMGDATVEMPNYNILPADFGNTFGGAYRVQLEWKGGDINEEATDLSTGWVFSGKENDASAGKGLEGNAAAKATFQKVAIVAPVLAKRLGVKVEHVNIDVPGVGAQIVKNDKRAGLDAIRVWGLVYIQRQLGMAHTMTLPLPYRPFLLPNRPIHVVPRQRIGIISEVNYSFSPPMGECTVDVGTRYVRWLHRDGTFRTIAGGFRQPVDYTGFFTGVQGFRVKEGVVGNLSSLSRTDYDAYRSNLAAQGLFDSQGKPKYDRNQLAFSCAPGLKDAFKDSQNSYDDDVSARARAAFRYNDKTIGSDGAAGAGGYPAIQNGTMGRPVRRPVSDGSKSEPASAVALKGTGLRASDKKNKDADGKNKPRYNLTNLFNNPFPYGMGNGRTGRLPDGSKSKFNNWINRYFDTSNLTGNYSGAKGGKLAAHKGKSVAHSGIDILAKVGTDILAPINTNWNFTNLTVGPFAEGSAKNPVKWVHFKSKKEMEGALKFVVYKSWFPMIQNTGGDKWKALLYIRQWKAWNDSGKSKAIKIIRGGGASGLRIVMNGYVQPPKLQENASVSRDSKKLSSKNALYTMISVAHCSFVSVKTLKDKARKGEVVGKVGMTGTWIPHAHVDMWIWRTRLKTIKRRKGKTYRREVPASDQDLFKAAAAANREYMESLILLKVTGGKPDSGQISPEWQKYFKSRGVKVNSVREAVDVLYKSNKWFVKNSSPNSDKILTNAFLYFRPDEIVRGVNAYDQYKNVFYSTSPIEGKNSTGSKQSVCGKLPEYYVKKLQVQLKSCYLKVGKVYKHNLGTKKTYRSRRRLRCDQKYKSQLASLEYQWKIMKSTDGNERVNQKLNAQVDRGLRAKAQSTRNQSTGSYS